MFSMAVDLVSVICVVGMFMAVLSNFIGGRSARQYRERRSLVATFSMVLFAVALFLTLRFRIGFFTVGNQWSVFLFRAMGSLVMLVGLAFNLWGRMHLKGNWSDHVRVYEDHFLVTDGPYRFVRHPLYASLIWMFLGASAAYLNWLSAVETLLVFVPAMSYRARLEEQALEAQFGDAYAAYRRTTPRFFPPIWPTRESRNG